MIEGEGSITCYIHAASGYGECVCVCMERETNRYKTLLFLGCCATVPCVCVYNLNRVNAQRVNFLQIFVLENLLLLLNCLLLLSSSCISGSLMRRSYKYKFQLVRKQKIEKGIKWQTFLRVVIIRRKKRRVGKKKKDKSTTAQMRTERVDFTVSCACSKSV